MHDRRTGADRRARHLIPEQLERKKERRGGDRRDWPRPEVALDVREPGMKSRSCTGDLSPEGAMFVTTAPPLGDQIEMMFSIPTYVGPVTARAKVIGRSGAKKGTQVSVAFTDIDVEAELAIAQWLHVAHR